MEKGGDRLHFLLSEEDWIDCKGDETRTEEWIPLPNFDQICRPDPICVDNGVRPALLVAPSAQYTI